MFAHLCCITIDTYSIWLHTLNEVILSFHSVLSQVNYLAAMWRLTQWAKAESTHLSRFFSTPKYSHAILNACAWQVVTFLSRIFRKSLSYTLHLFICTAFWTCAYLFGSGIDRAITHSSSVSAKNTRKSYLKAWELRFTTEWLIQYVWLSI